MKEQTIDRNLVHFQLEELFVLFAYTHACVHLQSAVPPVGADKAVIDMLPVYGQCLF